MMNKIQLILIFTILLCAGNIYAQNKGKMNPNISLSAISGYGETDFGGSFIGLSNKEKHGQFGAGIGFFPIPGGDVYFPVFMASRIKITQNAVRPVIDMNIGYGIYSSKYLMGRLYANIGAGLMFPGKKMQPFVLFKYEMRQFELKTRSSVRTINNYNYFNASIGLSI